MPSREQHALIAVQDVVFDNDAIKQAMTDSDYKNLMDNLMLVYRALPRHRESQQQPQSRAPEPLNMLLDVAALTSSQPTNNGPPPVAHDFTSDISSENESTILTQVRNAFGYNNPRPSPPTPEPSHPLPSPPPVAHSRFQPIPPLRSPRYRLGDTIPLYIRPEQSQIQSRCMMCKHCRKIKNWGECSSITCSLRRDVCYRAQRTDRSINPGHVDYLIGRFYTNYQCHYFRNFLTPQEILQLPEGGISGLEVIKIRMCKVPCQRRRLMWFQHLYKHLQDNHHVDPMFLSQDSRFPPREL